MDTLTYSSNELSELNNARRSLWSDRYMQNASIEEPGKYETPEFWQVAIDRSTEELKQVAHKLKSVLMPDPTVGEKVFQVILGASCFEQSTKIRADSRGEVIFKAERLYKNFHIVLAEEIK